MRSILYSLALTVAVGVAMLLPGTASAAPRIFVGVGYGGYYAPSYYYTPAYTYSYTTPYANTYYTPTYSATSYYEPTYPVAPAAYTYVPTYGTYSSPVYGSFYVGPRRLRWR
jgi:hypothetical protein